MRTLVFLLLVTLSAAAWADEPGYLLLPSHSDIADRHGALAAQLFVYGPDGQVVHSGRAGGQFEAGEYVEVQPGWYFIEVGRYRAPDNARKVYVDADHVTVIPSGWVSVRTPPVSNQPSNGCNQWNSELNSFAPAADGSEAVTSSNRGAGVQEWGAIQLAAGPQLVYFNEVPVTVIVEDGELNELPTGFQDPVYGVRPQLATTRDGEGGLRIPLCADGALQVPAGDYWTSGAVPTETYPYERREWNRVTVPVAYELEHRDLRLGRLEHDRFEGEGAEPQPLTPEERELLGGGGTTGNGIQLTGFGR